MTESRPLFRANAHDGGSDLSAPGFGDGEQLRARVPSHNPGRQLPGLVTTGIRGRSVAVGVLAVWCTVALCVVGISWALEGHGVWTRLGVSYDPGPWCERERTDDVLREPANALSDLSFLAVGLYQICVALEDWIVRIERSNARFADHYDARGTEPSNLLVAFPALSLFFGLANVVHAVGTFTNHACRCHSGHRLDVTGMVLVVAVLTLYNAARLINLKLNLQKTFGFVFVVVFGGAVVATGLVLYGSFDLYYRDPMCRVRETQLLVGAIVAALVTTAAFNVLANRCGGSSGGSSGAVVSDHRLLGGAVALLLTGFVAHRADVGGALCWPDSWLQLHAVWHVATAGALHLVYLYLRSQHRTEPDKII